MLHLRHLYMIIIIPEASAAWLRVRQINGVCLLRSISERRLLEGLLHVVEVHLDPALWLS